MNDRPTYGVTVQREGQLWTATVDGLPGNTNTATDVEQFADLEAEVRDFIATVADTASEAFDLVWRYTQGQVDYTSILERLHARDAQLDSLTEERDAARRAAIKEMRNARLSLRAIAEVLGLSHQRVDQLSREVG